MRFVPHLFLAVAVCITSTASAEDLRAKTDDGREVVLKADGTWAFVDDPKTDGNEDEATSYTYEGRRKNFALRLKPGVWVKAEESANPSAEVMFEHAEGEVFAMVISERIAIPLDVLKKVALQNMQNVDEDAKILREESRKVDGVDVLCVTSEVTNEGVPLTFLSYYYSGTAGSIQVVTWTGQNLFDEVKPDMERFLDGLVILKK